MSETPIGSKRKLVEFNLANAEDLEAYKYASTVKNFSGTMKQWERVAQHSTVQSVTGQNSVGQK